VKHPRRARGATPAARRGFPGRDEAARNTARLNFIGIVFCMCSGTAALPHILMALHHAQRAEARTSCSGSLVVFLLYFTGALPGGCWRVRTCTPNLVGSSFALAPGLGVGMGKVDPSLLSIVRCQQGRHRAAGRIVIGGDLIVLATPEIAACRTWWFGPGAAGGLAAALSTATGCGWTLPTHWRTTSTTS